MKLLSNFAGHKENHPFNFSGCDIYLDPFAGNGGGVGIAIESGCKTLLIAEKEPSMRMLWSGLNAGCTKDIEDSVLTAASRLNLSSNDGCRLSIEALWRGKVVDRLAAKVFLSFLAFNGLTRTRRHDPDELWICVYPWAPIGGGKGRLSGSTAREKGQHLQNRCRRLFSTWSKIKRQLSEVDLTIFDDAQSLQMALPNLPKGTIGALIDPPYYLNKLDGYKTISPSYQGHQPYAIETWQLCEDAVTEIAPIAETLFVTNYHSREYESLAGQWELLSVREMTLRTCGFHAKNKLVSESGKAHRKKKTPIELTYFKGNRDLLLPKVEQLSFLAA
jgi:hypothetical protein